MKSIKKLTKVILFVIIASVIASSVMIISGYKLYKETLDKTDITQIVDSIREKPDYVEINDLPANYVNAVIAVEDHRFYNHGAIDIISIGRAILTDIKDLRLAEGGSTITQQVAKNLFFTQNKEFTRKIAEIFMAFDLEKKYGKDDILELYVNTIYFGNGYYGVNEAAKGYFKKHPGDLSLSESAMLAGIPNAPGVYALTNDSCLADKRKEQVLGKMVEYGFIGH